MGATDDEDLTVEFFETDWDTYLSVRKVIERDSDRRFELSHIHPERSHVPQSMSVHLLIRFSNGDVLAMKRKEGVASDGGSWAFSCEEQLHENDFRNPENLVADHLFKRAFIEEVFGRRDADRELVNRIWARDCAGLVGSHRLWTFFLEEHVGIFQTFGVIQLSIGPKELRSLHEAAVSAGWGTTDPEGYWYVVDPTQVTNLLTVGSGEASRLHGDPERLPLNAADLHPTARYRLWRLHAALNRTGQTLTELDLR